MPKKTKKVKLLLSHGGCKRLITRIGDKRVTMLPGQPYECDKKEAEALIAHYKDRPDYKARLFIMKDRSDLEPPEPKPDFGPSPGQQKLPESAKSNTITTDDVLTLPTEQA